jgi:hypothetical protein
MLLRLTSQQQLLVYLLLLYTINECKQRRHPHGGPNGVGPRHTSRGAYEGGVIRPQYPGGALDNGTGTANCMMSALGAHPQFEAFTFVLTAGCWPLQSVSSTFKPPAPIEAYVHRCVRVTL